MSSFSNCSELRNIKSKIEELLPDLYERYIHDNNNVMNYFSIFRADSYRLYMILLQNIKTPIDFHLFYRWIGLDSDWAISSPNKQKAPADFWWTCFENNKVNDILIKIVKDYKEVCSKP